MATQAYWRACHLSDPTTPVVGLGCTAAIATDRDRRGHHHAYISVVDSYQVTSYELLLQKGARDRAEEEYIVSSLLVKALAQACGVADVSLPLLLTEDHLETHVEPYNVLNRLLDGEANWVLALPDGTRTAGQTWSNIAMLSGSFNPVHTGHRQLRALASEILGQPVYFEIPLINADKAPISVAETERRLTQFTGDVPVILSRAPLFSLKAEIFPQSVFVLGIDTAKRLTQPRFYNDDPDEMLASFETIRRTGCRILVAGRLVEGQFITLSNINLPPNLQDLFEGIPEEHFRIDLSSTMLRRQK
ncbi:MAG: hypothetical protein AAF485_18330 [Chloroflexota bacterium]